MGAVDADCVGNGLACSGGTGMRSHIGGKDRWRDEYVMDSRGARSHQKRVDGLRHTGSLATVPSFYRTRVSVIRLCESNK